MAELELQASQALQRLETIKISPNPEATAPPTLKTSTSSTTGLLSNDRHAPTDVLSYLESIIVTNATEVDENDESDITEAEYLLPALNEVSHLALISHSIIAYLSHLDYRKLTKITAKISGDTNRWLAYLFRFIDANASYHIDSTDAILRAVRYMIQTFYSFISVSLNVYLVFFSDLLLLLDALAIWKAECQHWQIHVFISARIAHKSPYSMHAVNLVYRLIVFVWFRPAHHLVFSQILFLGISIFFLLFRIFWFCF